MVQLWSWINIDTDVTRGETTVINECWRSIIRSRLLPGLPKLGKPLQHETRVINELPLDCMTGKDTHCCFTKFHP